MVKNIIITVILILVISFAKEPDITFSQIREAYKSSFTLEANQQYAQAIDILIPVLKAYPETYTINYRLGWLNYLNGRHADALQHFEKALKAYPNSLEVLNSICLVHQARQNWEKMEEGSLKALKIDYSNYYANLHYINALKMQKKFDMAIKISEKLLALYPSSTDFLFAMAESLYGDQQFKESIFYYESVIVLNPYNYVAMERLKSINSQSKGK